MTERQPAPSAVEHHIQTVAAVERQALDQRTRGERLGDAVAARVGSTPMVLYHAAWFLGWVVVNQGWIPGVRPFDPFPFGFLTLVVSLEAIFLSLFLLISQNRLTRQSDRRSHLDLQVNLLIETEVTKMLFLMERVCQKLDIDLSDDAELPELASVTDLRALVRAVDSDIPEPGGRAAPPRTPQEQDGPSAPGSRP